MFTYYTDQVLEQLSRISVIEFQTHAKPLMHFKKIYLKLPENFSSLVTKVHVGLSSTIDRDT